MRDPKAIGIAVAVIAVAGVWWVSSGKDSAREFASFDADALRVSDLVGSLHVEVTNDPEMTVTVQGPSDALKRVDITTRNGTLVIDQDRGLGWIRIFGFRDRKMEISVRVPRGTPVAIDDLVGELYIGDIMAPIDFRGHLSEGHIGDVTEAALAVSGSGNLWLGDVAGELALTVSGSAHATFESAGTAALAVTGSGELFGGDVRAGLALNIRGSGEANIDSLSGPARIEISGSGSAHIGSGRASAFVARISGSGDLVFGGTAVDPDLRVTGSGHITLAAHEGTLTADGVNIVVNGERVANR